MDIFMIFTRTIKIFFITLILLGYGSLENYAHCTNQKEIVIKGQLGSGYDQVGEKINDDYTVLPSSIAIDSTSSIYLADNLNNRIQKFDSRGKYLFTLKLKTVKNCIRKIVDDLAVDTADNLYAASGCEKKIYKYSVHGKKLAEMNISKKEIVWNGTGWQAGHLQIEKIVTDVKNNIYLKGFDELVKFDADGNILAKWAPIGYLRTSVFALDSEGALFLIIKKGNTIEKYNYNEKFIDRADCGELLSLKKDNSCFLPEFIDKQGNRYFFEKNKVPLSSQVEGTTVKRVDKEGKNLNQFVIDDFDIYGHTVKFDLNGNLYILNSSKNEFWIEKHSWK